MLRRFPVCLLILAFLLTTNAPAQQPTPTPSDKDKLQDAQKRIKAQLGAHWELWMLQQGGMTPLEALRCATLYGAQYLGLDADRRDLRSALWSQAATSPRKRTARIKPRVERERNAGSMLSRRF